MLELSTKHGVQNMGLQSDRDDNEAVRKACIRWMGYDERSQLTADNMYDFTAWLGDPVIFYPENDTWSRRVLVDMSKPEIRRKIEIINNSEHWRTLIKVMEIKRGET